MKKILLLLTTLTLSLFATYDDADTQYSKHIGEVSVEYGNGIGSDEMGLGQYRSSIYNFAHEDFLNKGAYKGVGHFGGHESNITGLVTRASNTSDMIIKGWLIDYKEQLVYRLKTPPSEQYKFGEFSVINLIDINTPNAMKFKHIDVSIDENNAVQVIKYTESSGENKILEIDFNANTGYGKSINDSNVTTQFGWNTNYVRVGDTYYNRDANITKYDSIFLFLF